MWGRRNKDSVKESKYQSVKDEMAEDRKLKAAMKSMRASENRGIGIWGSGNRESGRRSCRTPHAFKKGQALLELAVFSTIFLTILTAIVAYGLRYSYNQRAQMLAFRRAMKIASDRNYGSGSYMLIQDRHIPDPAETFGIGSTAPFVGVASVTRDPEMDAQAADASSLPATVIDMETTGVDGAMEPLARIVAKNAGFRRETGVSEEMLKKYELIYSDVVDEEGGNVRIIDSCVGEMINFDSCYSQAVKIVDVDTCYNYCLITVTQDEDTNCSTICNQAMNPPNQNNTSYNSAVGGAWYAANWRVEDGKYVFPVLNEISSRVSEHAKSMGIQQDTVTHSKRSTKIRKIETTSNLVTDENATWEDNNVRQFVTMNALQPNGYQVTHDNPMDYADDVDSQEINSRSTGTIRQTMTTPK
ncbi:MAG: hypothetical protein ACE14U_02630 [Candidatus Velamenicoccus archaeovorus]